MDQKKNRGQQSQDRNEPQTPLEQPTREPAEGPREETPEPRKPQAPPERGRRIPRERNSSSGSGISNRGMDRKEEQEDLPDRGSERQSER